MNCKDKKAVVSKHVFIAEDADIIGDVSIQKYSSVWYKAVLRGDVNFIKIGKYSNIQDGCVIHVSKEHPTIIGDYVTIGHNATVHGATLGNNCLIGMGSIILDGCEIGDYVIVGAGSLIPPNKKIPEGCLVLGSPAKIVRKLTEKEIKEIKESAITYYKLWENGE